MKRTLIIKLTKEIICVLLFCLFRFYCFGQEKVRYPALHNSIAVHEDPIALNYNVEVEFRIFKLFYIEGGIIPNCSAVQQSYPNVSDTSFTWYVGTGLIFRITDYLFFTPSLDLYLDKYHSYLGGMAHETYRTSGWSIGPTFGFQYILFKKLTIDLELLNLNLGRKEIWDSYYIYNSHRTDKFTSGYKVISIGLRYNFDLPYQNR